MEPKKHGVIWSAKDRERCRKYVNSITESLEALKLTHKSSSFMIDFGLELVRRDSAKLEHKPEGFMLCALRYGYTSEVLADVPFKMKPASCASDLGSKEHWDLNRMFYTLFSGGYRDSGSIKFTPDENVCVPFQNMLHSEELEDLYTKYISSTADSRIKLLNFIFSIKRLTPSLCESPDKEILFILKRIKKLVGQGEVITSLLHSLLFIGDVRDSGFRLDEYEINLGMPCCLIHERLPESANVLLYILLSGGVQAWKKRGRDRLRDNEEERKTVIKLLSTELSSLKKLSKDIAFFSLIYTDSSIYSMGLLESSMQKRILNLENKISKIEDRS